MRTHTHIFYLRLISAVVTHFSFVFTICAFCFVFLVVENLVPNVFLELFFVLQLLTCRSPPALEGERDGLCGSAHGEAVSSDHF